VNGAAAAMKIKATELTGAALDWAAAKADGWSNEGLEDIAGGDRFPEHDFSTNWAQGGPIIAREEIMFHAGETQRIAAYFRRTGTSGVRVEGDTHLIAAMRCFVAGALGDEVDVPQMVVL
jgi:hypothetical protein